MKKLLSLILALLTISAWAQTDSKELITQPRNTRTTHVSRLHAKTTPLKTSHQLRDVTSAKKSGMRKAASDYNIISETPAGELRTYNRTGKYYYRTSGVNLLDGDVSGLINIVFAEDGENVYIQGPVTGLDNDTWVRGTISGNTITVPLGQYMKYYPEYDACTVLRFLWTSYDEETSVLEFKATDDETATFIINEDGSIALQNSSEQHMLALIWSDDNDWSGFADYNSVYVPATVGQEVPYEKTFFNASDFADMTVVDANSDSKSWTYYYPVAMYEYSYTKKADDWLITKGIQMEAGKRYSFSIDICESSEQYGPERFEVKMGTAPMASSLTTSVLEPTDITSELFEVYENSSFTVPADGIYYFGVHAISDAYRDRIYVRSIVVEEAMSDNAPKAVQNLVATPDRMGAQKATITFDAPTLTIRGQQLGNVPMYARIYRDGEPLGNVDMTVGQKNVTFVDEVVPYFGTVTYAVVAYADGKKGMKAETEVYVGADYPLPVPELRIAETANGLKFEWDDVPEEGYFGGPVNLEDITYDLYRMRYNDNADTYDLSELLNGVPVKGNSYVYEPYPGVNLGMQGFQYYAIVPVSAITGKDLYTFTMAEVLEGAPDALPYRESVTGHKLSHFLTWSGTSQGVFLYYSNESSDGDDEAMKLESEMANATGAVETGKIMLAGASAPTLLFDALTSRTGNSVKVIAVTPDGTKHIVKTCTPGTEYSTFSADLSEFASEKWVRIFLETTFPTVSYVLFDNIQVVDLKEKDMALCFSAPKEVSAGQKAQLEVSVENHGQKKTEAYNLRITANDKEIFSQTVTDALGFYETKTFDVAYKPGIFAEVGDVQLRAELTYPGDEDNDDNIVEATISVQEPNASMPQQLDYDYNDGVVTLKWQKPAIPIEVITDGFEDYTPWTDSNIGAWTTVNADESLTMRLFSDLPVAFEGKPLAYTVWEYDGTNVQEGHNSNKFLAGLPGKTAEGKYAACDDWLISPELVGTAQTISFWVWGRQWYYEKYNVLYSTTDQDMESFVALNTEPIIANSGKWEKKSFELPEGAKYFAIQRKQTSGGDTWLFGLDDITYTMRGDDAVAYNIYINEMLAKTVPASELTFTLEHLSRNTHAMAVTAVYPDGRESRPVTVDVPVYKTTPIICPEGGEEVAMYLKGVDYVMESEISQHVKAVFFDDAVYMQGLRRSAPDAWVVGDIADGKVTFAPWHTIGTKNINGNDYGIFLEGLVPTTSEVGTLVMDYDAATHEMTANGQYICFNASFTSVVFDQIVIDPYITMAEDEKPELVTPPVGLQTAPGNVAAKLYYEHKTTSWPGEIGFDGTDCYLRGAFYYVPEAWLKGKVDGLRITFPTGQYMGDCSGFDSYMLGLDFDHSNGSMTFRDFVIVWNPETQCYEGENAAAYSVSLAYFAGIEIEENFRFYGGMAPPTDGIEDVTLQGDQSSATYNIQGQRVSGMQKGILIKNGRKFLSGK